MAVVCQVALGAFMLSLGIFILVFNSMNLALGAIRPVPPSDLRFWFYWIGPTFLVIQGIIGFIIARAWFKFALNPLENTFPLIALAFLSIVIAFLCPMIWLTQLFSFWLPEVWLNIFGLNQAYYIIFVLSFFPGLLVLVAGGGIIFYKIWSKGYIADSSDTQRRGVRPSPFMLAKALHRERGRGVRTSHFILAKAFHRERDRFRDSDT